MSWTVGGHTNAAQKSCGQMVALNPGPGTSADHANDL